MSDSEHRNQLDQMMVLSRPPTTGWLKALAEGFGLLVLLLPLVGVLGRALAFTIDPSIPWDLRLAVSLPVGDLMAIGAGTLLATVIIGPLLFVFLRVIAPRRFRLAELSHRRVALEQRLSDEGPLSLSLTARLHENQNLLEELESSQDPSQELLRLLMSRIRHIEDQIAALLTEEQAKVELKLLIDETDEILSGGPFGLIGKAPWLAWPLLVMLTALFVSTFLLGSWPVFQIGVIAGVLAVVLTMRATSGKRSVVFKDVLSAVAVYTVSGILAAGLAGSGFRAGQVQFTDGSVLEGGRYVEVGRVDQTAFLVDCDTPSSTLAVSVGQIAFVEFNRVARNVPNLLEVIRGDGRVIPRITDVCDG